MCAKPTPVKASGWRLLDTLLGLLVTIAIPTWLALSGTQLLATEVYLRLEYGKPDFPPDPYGFSQEERFAYAAHAIRYLRNDQGIEYLAALTLPDGEPLFNQRELHHMADVKAVVQAAFAVHGVLTVLLVGGVWYLVRAPERRPLLRRCMARAGYLTLSVILALALLAVLFWDTFFEGFHRLFFQDGTWRFAYTDALIRLFPERFWFDAALTLGVLYALSALTLIVFAWRWEYTAKAAAPDAAAFEQDQSAGP